MKHNGVRRWPIVASSTSLIDNFFSVTPELSTGRLNRYHHPDQNSRQRETSSLVSGSACTFTTVLNAFFGGKLALGDLFPFRHQIWVV
jgi:hypothetical protein